MNLKTNLKLFAKLFFGVATDKERQQIFTSEESQDMLQKTWEESELRVSRKIANKEDTFKNIRNQILSGTEKSISPFSEFIRKYAAILILTLSLAAAVTYIFLFDQPTEEIAYITKENFKGKRTSFLLPDGSKVWLNADSKITFPERFNNKERIVFLEGEAYFEVVKKSNKPFRVTTSDIKVEVLGTIFNVTAYPEDDYIQTTLVSGKIAISDRDQTTGIIDRYILTKNHQATFKKETREFEIDKVNAENFACWTKGKLIFEEVSFDNIQRILERKYNVEFVYGTELLLDYNFTMTITDESINDIMQLIRKTTPINYVIKDRKIYISE